MGKLIYHRYVLIRHNDVHGNDEMLVNKYSRTMPGGESAYLVMSERESRMMVRMSKKCPYCGATSLYRRVLKGGYRCIKCKQIFDNPTNEKN
jgi:DNA-directed RNA polymerase subunit RPC12/RpoP